MDRRLGYTFVERDDGNLESFDTAIYFAGDPVLSETEQDSSTAPVHGWSISGRELDGTLPLQDSGREAGGA